MHRLCVSFLRLDALFDIWMISLAGIVGVNRDERAWKSGWLGRMWLGFMVPRMLSDGRIDCEENTNRREGRRRDG